MCLNSVSSVLLHRPSTARNFLSRCFYTCSSAVSRATRKNRSFLCPIESHCRANNLCFLFSCPSILRPDRPLSFQHVFHLLCSDVLYRKYDWRWRSKKKWFVQFGIVLGWEIHYCFALYFILKEMYMVLGHDETCSSVWTWGLSWTRILYFFYFGTAMCFLAAFVQSAEWKFFSVSVCI